MWKACLVLVGHRLLLLVAAFLAINASVPRPEGANLPRLLPIRDLGSRFHARVHEGAEFAELAKLLEAPPSVVFSLTKNPFLWVARLLCALTGLSSFACLLFLSNLFLLLLVRELVALASRMTTMDVAEAGAILFVVWPTSYELGLGSSLSLACLLSTLAVREAIDNKWLIGGAAIALLTLMDPFALGLLPLMIYLFWYFQRHFQLPQVVKRTAFFLIPVSIALFVHWDALPSLKEIASESALANVFSALKKGTEGMAWTVSRSYGGQTLTIVVFAIGAVTSALSNTGVMHRLIPAYLLVAFLIFSPYGALASRAAYAAVCLEGIAAASSPIVLRVVQALLVGLSVFEVCLVFSSAA